MYEITIHNINGQSTVSSVQVANDFGKRHDNVIRDIESLIDQIKDLLKIEEIYFTKSIYFDNYGREQKSYEMTKDGFSLLAMGFTGKKALEWKLRYIDAFNKMIQYCQSDSSALLQRQNELESRMEKLERRVNGDDLTARDIIAFRALVNMFSSPTCKLTIDVGTEQHEIKRQTK
ncbi:MAG: Rha family transcriptional regulator [Ruminococcus sp.]|nr:Rha family transcriptional regulator [Ruminococcus sp.]